MNLVYAVDDRPKYLASFAVGDQLLWGAVEPLRRMLIILLDREV